MSFHEPRTFATVTILNVIDDGSAFGRNAEDGKAVFVSKYVTKRVNIQPGDVVTAVVSRNTAQPDKTPWFAHDLKLTGSGRAKIEPDAVLALMRETGGSWTAAEVAGQFVDQPTALDVHSAEAALEVLYRQCDDVAKAALFTKSDRNAVKFWFTCYPDDCDFAEFDE